MCSGSGPSAPPPVQAVPEEQDAGVLSARDAERKRRRASASSTLFTSPQGVTSQANTGLKSLFGQ